MNKPRRQHTVPKVYLSNFTNEKGLLNVYDIKNKMIREQHPKTTTIYNDFYTVNFNGAEDFFVEELLNREVDNDFRWIVEKIKNEEIISFEEKKCLAKFITFQSLRTPKHRKNHDLMIEKIYKRTNKLLASNPEYLKKNFSHGEVNEIKDILLNEKYNVEVPKEKSIAFMLDFANEMMNMLLNHNWYILISPKKGAFITSDNPYAMIKEDWAKAWPGYGIINTCKVFPLTPNYAIVLRNPGRTFTYIKADRDHVREVNILVALWADKYLIGTNKQLLFNIANRITKPLKG